jgi:hypothetical protein
MMASRYARRCVPFEIGGLVWENGTLGSGRRRGKHHEQKHGDETHKIHEARRCRACRQLPPRHHLKSPKSKDQSKKSKEMIRNGAVSNSCVSFAASPANH